MLTPEFEAALKAIQNPLRFACGDDFARLERVKNLQQTLRQGAERAKQIAPGSDAIAALDAFSQGIPADDAHTEVRKESLRQSQARLQELLQGRWARVSMVSQAKPTEVVTSKSSPPAGATKKKRTHRRGVRSLSLAEIRQQPLASPPDSAPMASAAISSHCTDAPEVAAEAGGQRVAPQELASAPQVLAEDASLQYLRGVGPHFAKLLLARGLKTIGDLLRFLPRRYEDRRGAGTIAELEEGAQVTFEAEVVSQNLRRMGRRRTLEVTVSDGSGALSLVWFRVPGGKFADRFQPGVRLRISGQVKRYRNRLQLTHPETRILAASTLQGTELPFGTESDKEALPEPPEDRLVPAYLEVPGMRPARLRQIIDTALEACPQPVDILPQAVRERRNLPPLADSLRALHQPPHGAILDEMIAMATPWHRRLIYEELLLLQLAVLKRKAMLSEDAGQAFEVQGDLLAHASRLFVFELTAAQKRVLASLQEDLRQKQPMTRLLQGDVGSGKTAVALTLAAAVAKAGLQVALMAPTEILAEQHMRNALKTLHGAGVRVGLLTGSLSAPERRRTLAQIRDGHVQVVIGTHAIIQEAVQFKNLALGIVDEQHRFGVMQRAKLVEMGLQTSGHVPHLLVMTATPIPRTLALTVYGDLDVAVIDELPAGRKPIRTKVFRDKQRGLAYQRLRAHVQEGRQAYVVFPLVEESDGEGMQRLRDATSAAEELANGDLRDFSVGLLHGRMHADDKDRIMRRFANGEIQVLVATTVIEVGIDVPNATVMLIENSERFGLSQLHQLRGRVGRGEHASECLLLAQYTPSEDAWRRLMVMERHHDGFKIAEEDLAIRGPGDFIGTRQSGLPMLSVADLSRDAALMEEARADAARLLLKDPELSLPDHKSLGEMLAKQWSERLELARIG